MIKIIKAELCRSFIELFNYYPDQIVDILIKYILFYAFFNTRSQNGDNSVFLWSYLYWILASNVISEMSIVMSSEKQIGTIEQLMIMPANITTIMIVRTYVVFSIGLIKATLLACLVWATTSYTISFNLSLLMVFVISILGFTGLGLLLSGLTLKFAKVASFEQLMSYGLLLLTGVITSTSTASDAVSILKYFPYRIGIQLLHQGVHGAISSIEWLTLAIGNAIFWLLD